MKFRPSLLSTRTSPRPYALWILGLACAMAASTTACGSGGEGDRDRGDVSTRDAGSDDNDRDAGSDDTNPSGARFALNGDLTCSPSEGGPTTVPVGGDCAATVSAKYLKGDFDEPIVLSVEGLRPGVTAEFSYVGDNIGLVPTTGGAIFKLSVRGAADAGPLEVVVTGTTASHGEATLDLSLTITSRPGFPLASVAVGSDIACGVEANGQAYCWGSNSQGQLGIGTTADSGDYWRTKPTAVVGDIAFSKVVPWASQTCGLDTDGKAHCWGYGYLGDGVFTNPPRPEPAAVSGGLSYVDIVVAGAVFCGLTGDGDVYCWHGGNGLLGDGTWNGSPVPKKIGEGRTYIGVASAGTTTCILSDEGGVYCWGNNTYGHIGEQPPGQVLSPTRIDTTLAFKAIAMTSGTVCGLTDEGAAYCWGTNTGGALGIGVRTGDKHLVPQPVVGDYRFTTLSGGSGGLCALDENGKAYCWGWAGQEGSDPTAPTPLSGDLLFSQISVGHDMGCGVAKNGLAAAYCWRTGNYDGYLGTGDTVSYKGPVPIAAP